MPRKRVNEEEGDAMAVEAAIAQERAACADASASSVDGTPLEHDLAALVLCMDEQRVGASLAASVCAMRRVRARSRFAAVCAARLALDSRSPQHIAWSLVDVACAHTSAERQAAYEAVFASGIALWPPLLAGLAQLTSDRDYTVHQPSVIAAAHASARATTPAAWCAVLHTLPRLNYAAFSALRALGLTAGLSVPRDVRLALARAMLQRRRIKDATSLLTDALNADIVPLLSAAELVQELGSSDMIPRLASILAAGADAAQQAECVSLLCANRAVRECGQLARKLKVDLQAYPVVNAAIKQHFFSGMLRDSVRDLVVWMGATDRASLTALHDYMTERVALGKTLPDVAEQWRDALRHAVACFPAATLDAAGARAYEAALHDFDVATGRIFRVGGMPTSANAETSQPAAETDAGGCAGDDACEEGEEEEGDAPADADAVPGAGAVAASGAAHTSSRVARKVKNYVMPAPQDAAGIVEVPLAWNTAPACALLSSHTLLPDARTHLPARALDAAGNVRLSSNVRLHDVGCIADLEAMATLLEGERAEAHASGGAHAAFLGMDSEWVADTPAGEQQRSGGCAILTLSYGCHVWLISMPHVHAEVLATLGAPAGTSARADLVLTSPAAARCNAAFARILMDQRATLSAPERVRVVVAVYGGSLDFSVISKAYPYLTAFARIAAWRSPLLPAPEAATSTRASAKEARVAARAAKAAAAAAGAKGKARRKTKAPDAAAAPDASEAVADATGATGAPSATSAPPTIIAAERAGDAGAAAAGPAEEDAMEEGVVYYVDLMTLSRAAFEGPPLQKRSKVRTPAQPVHQADGAPVTLAAEEGGATCEATDSVPTAPEAAPEAASCNGHLAAGGLTGLCQTLLGGPLNKYWQMSYWDRWPLVAGQREYAAADAWVLTPLLYMLLALLPPRRRPASS